MFFKISIDNACTVHLQSNIFLKDFLRFLFYTFLSIELFGRHFNREMHGKCRREKNMKKMVHYIKLVSIYLKTILQVVIKERLSSSSNHVATDVTSSSKIRFRIYSGIRTIGIIIVLSLLILGVLFLRGTKAKLNYSGSEIYESDGK